MLELNDVGLFVEVVRRGSLSEAGRRLGMPPNTVSQRIDQLAASCPPRRHSDRAGRAPRR
jgi:DNA-binding transcriptional LysR family regulator